MAEKLRVRDVPAVDEDDVDVIGFEDVPADAEDGAEEEEVVEDVSEKKSAKKPAKSAAKAAPKKAAKAAPKAKAEEKKGPDGPFRLPESGIARVFKMCNDGTTVKAITEFCKRTDTNPGRVLRVMRSGNFHGWRWKVDEANGRLKILNVSKDRK